MTEAVSEMQILLDKRSQYLTPEQTRQIRNSISRLSAGYDAVYDVSSSTFREKLRKKNIDKRKTLVEFNYVDATKFIDY